MSAAAKPCSQSVSDVPQSSSSGPPAASTRNASSSQTSPNQPEYPEQRGSSADHEDVSMQLAQPPSSQSSTSSSSTSESPTKRVSPRNHESRSCDPPVDDDHPQRSPSSSRPSRAVKPTATRGRLAISTPAAPWMSGKELKTTTDRNTMRNQVYLCAIDRQVVHINGPRPPSPTSKIRTTADRDEEEKKRSRESRAKRRGTATTDGSPEKPVIERVDRARGPGDDEDWKTPARPAKKAKMGQTKTVKWDRGLVIIRDDGSAVCPRSSDDNEVPKRSCVRLAAKVSLMMIVAIRHNLRRI